MANVEAHYRVTPEALKTYARAATIAPDEFLNPEDPDRYIVVSVDPAAGGILSEEALVVFLVAGARFALLTGRTHSPVGQTGA